MTSASSPLNYQFWRVSLTGHSTGARLMTNYLSSIPVHDIGVIREIAICRNLFARIHIQSELFYTSKFRLEKIHILIPETIIFLDVRIVRSLASLYVVDPQTRRTLSAAERFAESILDLVQQTHLFPAIKAFSPVKCHTNLVSTPSMTGNATLLAQRLVRVSTKFSAVFAEEFAFPTTCRD